jgi:hypothetical protein
MPHCRAPSLWFQLWVSSEARIRKKRRGCQEAGRKPSDTTHIPFLARLHGSPDRAPTPDSLTSPSCRVKVGAEYSLGRSNGGPGYPLHLLPRTLLLGGAKTWGKGTSLELEGEGGRGNLTPKPQPPLSCVSGLVITSPQGFQTREAICSSTPANDLSCSSGISA